MRASSLPPSSAPAGGVGVSGAVLIYDADCGFCQRCLALGRRVLPWTPRAVGFQHVDLARYGVTQEQARRAIQLCRPGRPVRRGAAAISVILQAQPGQGWRLAGEMLDAPPVSWLAAGCYRLVARLRTRLPGSTCAVDSREAGSARRTV